MSDLTDTLEKVIQQAALDGALTADAVSQFHSLVVERNALKDANVEWEETDEKHKKDYADLNQLLSQTNTQLGDYQTRERELVERETKNLTLQLNAEHEAKRVTDHKEMFKTVFRNSVLRKTVVTPVHVSESGMHGSTDLNTVEEEKT